MDEVLRSLKQMIEEERLFQERIEDLHRKVDSLVSSPINPNYGMV